MQPVGQLFIISHLIPSGEQCDADETANAVGDYSYICINGYEVDDDENVEVIILNAVVAAKTRFFLGKESWHWEIDKFAYREDNAVQFLNQSVVEITKYLSNICFQREH